MADDEAPGVKHDRVRSEARTRYSLFVPNELRTVASLMVEGNRSRGLSEAERLALLGSSSAKAFLAYAEMLGLVVGELRFDRAQRLAMEAAQSGNPFGLYVLGWIRFAQNRHTEAFASLLTAAKQLFLPAIVDVGRFVAVGIGVARADARSAPFSDKAFAHSWPDWTVATGVKSGPEQSPLP
jgi:hypothetical protein